MEIFTHLIGCLYHSPPAPSNKTGGLMTSSEFKELRQKMRITQVALGNIMGMSRRQVWGLENKRTPTKIHTAFIKFIYKHRRNIHGRKSGKREG
jgi:DNA-binding XRE family transcriptional regulator